MACRMAIDGTRDGREEGGNTIVLYVKALKNTHASGNATNHCLQYLIFKLGSFNI